MHNTHGDAVNGIQSLDRGLEILKLLAEEGRLTASSAAERLGIHQSSASRLLMSLQKAGLVRKPDFHSFAPDFGLLSFAGAAMESFPEVPVCADVCGRLARDYGCCSTAATLFRGRLIYLAWVEPGAPLGLKLVDDSRFPIYRSSLGLVLAYRLGRQGMLDLLEEKLSEDGVPEAASEALRLHDLVESGMAADGFLDLKGVGHNAFNFAMDFEGESGHFAYALFAGAGELGKQKAKTALMSAIDWSVKTLSCSKGKRKGGAK